MFQGFLGGGVFGAEFQGFFKALAGFLVKLLRHVDAAQVVVREVVGIVAARLNRTLEPRQRLIEIALFDQIGSDIVIRVAEIRVNPDRFLHSAIASSTLP